MEGIPDAKNCLLHSAPSVQCWIDSNSGATAANAGDVHVEADAEDGGLGLLRCEGGARVAAQVGRYGADSDADPEQSEAAGRCGPASRSGRAIAARHHRT